MQIAECNAPVAKNIAGVIENKGLKQVYIAEKAGYSPQELNDMEQMLLSIPETLKRYRKSQKDMLQLQMSGRLLHLRPDPCRCRKIRKR